jgi:phage terminase large subunit-like protein
LPNSLYPYQRDIFQAIWESVREEKGITFSVEIARQGGKNELSATLETLLLLSFFNKGGNIIKCAPTFSPQTLISMTRLTDTLRDCGMDAICRDELGYIIRLQNARAIFLSADESASVVGNTAHILLEIDESQDVSKKKYTRDFRPMGATPNVTTVHYGTAWDDSTLLEEV